MTPIRVLLVEDIDEHADIIQRVLAENPTEFTYQRIHDLNYKIATEVNAVDYDCVLLDLMLPSSGGIQTLRNCVEWFPHLTVVVLSSLHNDAFIQQCIREGAMSYWVKDRVYPYNVLDALKSGFLRKQEEARKNPDTPLALIEKLQEDVGRLTKIIRSIPNIDV